jgi:catechol 2,3-dioxygenase-like lactoylglutathione lyase family enzyme
MSVGRENGSQKWRLMDRFQGFDHIDARVPSLAQVEPFYDRFFSALGLGRKRFAVVDAHGEWADVPPGGRPNVTEYYEETSGEPARFMGIIEDAAMSPTKTRIAFRIEATELEAWYSRLHEIGARYIEWSDDMISYPAIFFEDPVGTKLELCARPKN